MRPIQFELSLFASATDRTRSQRGLLVLMYALARLDLDWLQTHSTPALYSTAVLYRAEEIERWSDIPNVIQRGTGDCEDLACWRIAELLAQGTAAQPYLSWRSEAGKQIYHALVRWPDGRIEDPSRALGMAGHPVVRRPVFLPGPGA